MKGPNMKTLIAVLLALLWSYPARAVFLDIPAGQVAAMQALAASLASFNDANGYATLRLSGVNLSIVNGLGASDSHNGTGNLIIGYNETEGRTVVRTGSHALIIGRGHEWLDYGCFVQGFKNSCLGDYGVALGVGSVAYDYASVLGGANNVAGSANPADNALYSVVVGGRSNIAKGYGSAILGGELGLTASGGAPFRNSIFSSITGGANNLATGDYSSVNGGYLNAADGYVSEVEGGYANRATGFWSQIVGGAGVTQSTNFGVSAGSLGPTLSGHLSSP